VRSKPPAPEPAREARRWRRSLKGAGRVAIAAAIIAYQFSQIPAAEVLRSVTGASAGPLLGSVLVVFVLQLIAAYRLRCLANAYGVGLSTRALFNINLATIFYGLCLPAGNVTGFIARVYLMSAPQKQYVSVALALACDRLVATGMLCVVGIGFWLLAWPVGAWPVLGVMLAALVGLLLLQAVLFMQLPIPFPAILWPARLDWLRGTLHRSRGLPPATLAWAFGLGILMHVLGTIAYGLVASALHLDLTLATIGWTRAAAMLAAILPISVAGLGVREGVLVLLLAPYGVGAPDALAYSLLAFAATVLAPGLVGALIEAERLVIRPLLRQSRVAPPAAAVIRRKVGGE
jgi:uncharacterized membrane protein YbhN (UPF0104 family)